LTASAPYRSLGELLLPRPGLRGSPPLSFGAPRRAGGGAIPTPGTLGPEGRDDARTGMPARVLAGAICVQRFDDSRNSAIHITYRIWLRSSSMPEPRDPLLKVFCRFGYPSHSELSLDHDPEVRAAGQRLVHPGRGPRPGAAGRGNIAAYAVGSQGIRGYRDTLMIPPLVHQRRPCYDFYFL
jgi:hypothetical protein